MKRRQAEFNAASPHYNNHQTKIVRVLRPSPEQQNMPKVWNNEAWHTRHVEKISNLGIVAYIDKNIKKNQTTTKAKKVPPQSQQLKRPTTKNKNISISNSKKPTWAILDHSSIQGIVACSCKFVEDELCLGLWPSPYWGTSCTMDKMKQHRHRIHMQTVAASLKQFSNDIILPTLQQQQQQQQSSPPSSIFSSTTESQPILPKCMIAVLLCLREVMTQNAEQIFGPLLPLDMTTTTTSADNDDDEKLLLKEEISLSAQLLATSVIISAIERFVMMIYDDDKVAAAVDMFLQVTEMYDGGDAEFFSFFESDESISSVAAAVGTTTTTNTGNLTPTTSTTTTIYKSILLPNGRPLKKEEEVARNVSWEQAKQIHPVVVRNMEKKLNIPPQQLVRVPEVNACHVSLVSRLN